MRIAIIGNSGSGKSTLAQQLAATHGLASLDLDSVAWEPGTVAVPRNSDAAVADAGRFCETHERWVVEGCYPFLIRAALEYSPVLLFTDPGVDVCLSNCRCRPWEPHKYATKDEQDQRLEFLLSWVREYYTRDGDLSFRAHESLFEAHTGAKYRLSQNVDRAFVEAQPLRWFSRDIDSFAARFTACQIPEKQWTHSAHLAVGLWHVHRFGPDEALSRLRVGIRRLNESQGGVNSATNGYHETITAAYVRLLSQFLDCCPREMPFPDRVAALLDSPLAAKRALGAFFSTERLMSTQARAEWVEPDIASLDMSALIGGVLPSGDLLRR